jgi:TonB family protein
MKIILLLMPVFLCYCFSTNAQLAKKPMHKKVNGQTGRKVKSKDKVVHLTDTIIPSQFVEEEKLFVEMAELGELKPAKKNFGDIVYRWVEQEAAFPGGTSKLSAFLSRELKYPKELQEKGEEGKVVFEFVVSKNGNITDIKIVQSAGKLFDEEALRVIKKMPTWIPGKQNGMAVNSYYSLPISFYLSE